MRVFVTYERERAQLDIADGDTVDNVKRTLRDLFFIVSEESSVLYLSYGGAELDDSWVITDIGIMSGSTLRLGFKDEVKPILYIYCAYSGDVVRILDDFNIPQLSVYDLRAVATRKTGIPLGVFRLVSGKGLELFDCYSLQEYEVNIGDTITLETWDGWNDLLNLAVSGFTSLVMKQLAEEELMNRYQMRVAMCIAAHHGHVDLAVSLLRQGIRADEPVGDHPSRQWCGDNHIDRLRAPIHIAAEMGQLGIVRTFVHSNLCYIMAKDGNGLMPLNIALRKKQKPCASFLLTKQWSKINYNTNYSIPISLYTKMKRWAEMAKEKVLTIGGQTKSSLKVSRKPRHTAALVGQGVILNGFRQSRMTSKTKAEARMLEEKSKRRIPNWLQEDNDEEKDDPETYFKMLQATQLLKLPKLSKFGRMMARASLQVPLQLATLNVKNSEAQELKNSSPSLTQPSVTPYSEDESHTVALNESVDRSTMGKWGRAIFRAKMNVDKPEESDHVNGTDQTDSANDANGPNKQNGRLPFPFSKLAGKANPDPPPSPKKSNPSPTLNTLNAAVGVLNGASEKQSASNASAIADKNNNRRKVKPDNVTDASKFRLPPIKEKSHIKAVNSRENLTSESRTESQTVFKSITHQQSAERETTSPKLPAKTAESPSGPGKWAYITTPKSKHMPTTSSVKSGSTNADANNNNNGSTKSMPALPTQSKKRKKRTIKSAILLAKAKRGETSIPLPIVSVETNGKPFYYTPSGKEDSNKLTLEIFDKYRGETPRDYAIKCLSVATNFKEKPWLQQVRMAMAITAQGVKKIASGNPHLMADSSTQSTPRPIHATPEQSVS